MLTIFCLGGGGGFQASPLKLSTGSLQTCPSSSRDVV
jgi:hypothetical protein